MGLFDQITNALSKAQSTANSLKNTVIPIEVQNLMDTHKLIEEKLTELEKNPELGATQNSPIIHLRTLLMNHYGHIQQGGEPDPFPAGKLHPLYQEAKNGYKTLDERLSKLERSVLKCTFAYQMQDGTMNIPTTDWSQEEWLNIKSRSKDGVARCWLDDDKNSYC